MKINKLKIIKLELDEDFNGENIKAQVYYSVSEEWWEVNGNIVKDEGKVKNLIASRSSGEPYRVKGGYTAWYPFNDMGFYISITFSRVPQKRNIGAINKKLEKIIDRAINSYKVSHNQLTYLLAKDSFRNELGKAIGEVSVNLDLATETHEVANEKILSILALDIDHFKQVNDTYGHLYGDQVLKVFALRLERCAKEIMGENKVDIFIGHPSGEEFLILINGYVTKDKIYFWANEFRKSISEKALPSDEEWARLSNEGDLSRLVLPLLHERTITTSIGLAYEKSLSESLSDESKINGLLNDADSALYRAKSSGRNQVIEFDEILSQCGRVLEHDSTVNVLALDIGKNAGVLLGQEFKVFPPSYTGKKNFTVNDGRTTRTIGTYPRVEIATITVFDVQPELSFASLSKNENTTLLIEPGSFLEAIPIGSIGHLLAGTTRYLSNINNKVIVEDFVSLKCFVKEYSLMEKKPFVIVFRFSAEQEFLKQYGSAAYNISLATLFEGINNKIMGASKIGVLDTNSICVVGDSEKYKEENVVEVFQKLKLEFNELKLKVGVFLNESSEDNKGDESILSSQNAIEFARYAASDNASASNDRVLYFSYKVANGIIHSQIKSGNYKQGIADYNSMFSLGVKSAEMYNVAGLLHYKSNEYKSAADLFEKAVGLSPEFYTYRTNFGTAACFIKEFDKGLKILGVLSDEDLKVVKEGHYYGYFMYAVLLVMYKIERGELNDFNDQRLKAMGRVILSDERFKDNPWYERIRNNI